MTNGTVVILGRTLPNLGAGMTGGKVYVFNAQNGFANDKYVSALSVSPGDADELLSILADYAEETGSVRAREIIDSWEESKNEFTIYVPVKEARKIMEQIEQENRIHAA
jgi:glutamate synthase domain-containing protein 3